MSRLPTAWGCCAAGDDTLEGGSATLMSKWDARDASRYKPYLRVYYRNETVQGMLAWMEDKVRYGVACSGGGPTTLVLNYA